MGSKLSPSVHYKHQTIMITIFLQWYKNKPRNVYRHIQNVPKYNQSNPPLSGHAVKKLFAGCNSFQLPPLED